MKTNFKNVIAVTLTTMFLTACGGGGGGSSSPSPTPSPTNPPTTPTNSAPVLSSVSDVVMDENSTQTVTLSATDADGDTLTYSASESSSALQATVSGTTLTLTAGEVTQDTTVTVTARVSDGTASDTETFTVDVNNVVVNTAPSVSLNPTTLELEEGQGGSVVATLSDSEDSVTSLQTNVTVDNTSIATVVETTSGFDVTAVSEGTVTITYTVTDTGGLNDTAQTVVTVVAPDVENEAPDFTIADQVEGLEQVVIFHNRETVLNVLIDDPDSTAHSLTMTRFEAVQGTTDLVESYFVNSQNKTITFDMKAIPQGNLEQMTFEMELNVTDDSENTTTKVYELFVEKSANASPVFSFSEKVGAFVLVNQNGETEITYTIDDDDASQVDVTGIQYWYGDETKFSVDLDAENQSFTVTTTDVEVGDAYGFVIQYVDVSLSGNVNVELYVKAPFGENEQQMRDLKEEMIKAREAVKEYVYIGRFYSQVLENMGYITQQQAEDFVERLDVDDSSNNQYSIFNLYIGNIEFYIASGDFQDDGFTSSYNTLTRNLLEESLSMGRNRFEIINEMAAISGDLLPEVTFEDTLTTYDETNQFVSRFVGNTAYGEYVDGVWVFDTQFAFMNGVLAQMEENATRIIDSE